MNHAPTCAGDGMCIDPRCPTHSPPEMRLAAGVPCCDLCNERPYVRKVLVVGIETLVCAKCGGTEEEDAQ